MLGRERLQSDGRARVVVDRRRSTALPTSWPVGHHAQCHPDRDEHPKPYRHRLILADGYSDGHRDQQLQHHKHALLQRLFHGHDDP